MTTSDLNQRISEAKQAKASAKQLAEEKATKAEAQRLDLLKRAEPVAERLRERGAKLIAVLGDDIHRHRQDMIEVQIPGRGGTTTIKQAWAIPFDVARHRIWIASHNGEPFVVAGSGRCFGVNSLVPVVAEMLNQLGSEDQVLERFEATFVEFIVDNGIEWPES